MSLGQFVAYFDFLSNEYLRLVAEASFHRFQGNHGILCSFDPCLISLVYVYPLYLLYYYPEPTFSHLLF
jgi:hypothetical protein